MTSLATEIVITFFILTFVGFVFLLNVAVEQNGPDIVVDNNNLLEDINHE